jgi:hypothetical protein
MTFRAELRAAIVTTATTYQSANPTLLRKVLPARPANFAEGPVAYVVMRETVTFAGGLRDRTMQPALIVVDSATDNIEAATRMDTLADALLEAFTLAPHASGAADLLEPIGIEDVEDQVGTVSYPGFQITFQAFRSEGRN